MKILSCAVALKEEYNVEFITNDLNLKAIANLFFDQVSSVEEETDDYKGFKDIRMTEAQMTNIYQHNINEFGLLPNEYLIVRDLNNNIVDRLCWTGEVFRHLDYSTFTS